MALPVATRDSFNTGKSENNVEAAGLSWPSPNPTLTVLSSSPIGDDLPGLTPITRNILLQDFFLSGQKNLEFSGQGQEDLSFA
jgi:hypothetical protein